jgi:hypothetical protein
MTGGALTAVVVVGSVVGVAGLAVSLPAVDETSRPPRTGVVAGGALTAVVVGGLVVGVAGLAVGLPAVAETSRPP